MVLIAIAVVVVFAILFDGPIPGSTKWESEYEAKWFTNHGYCETCGGAMDWQQKNKTTRYNAATGSPVYTTEWSCTIDPKHSHYGLVPWCVRENNV